MSDEELPDVAALADAAQSGEEPLLEEPAAADPEPKETPPAEAAQALAERTSKLKKEATQPPAKKEAISDEVMFQMRALQEFPDLSVEDSQFSKAHARHYQDLVRNGYTGPDAAYKAAQLAKTDPAVVKERNDERSRESGIQRSSEFPRPSSNRGGGSSTEAPRLTAAGEAQAARLGITTEKGKAKFAEQLRERARELARER